MLRVHGKFFVCTEYLFHEISIYPYGQIISETAGNGARMCVTTVTGGNGQRRTDDSNNGDENNFIIFWLLLCVNKSSLIMSVVKI